VFLKSTGVNSIDRVWYLIASVLVMRELNDLCHVSVEQNTIHYFEVLPLLNDVDFRQFEALIEWIGT